MRRRTAAALLALAPAVAFGQPPAPGERETPVDAPRRHQRSDRSDPPAAPEATPTDPGAPLPALSTGVQPERRMQRRVEQGAPAQPPTQFNPDPGGGPPRKPAVEENILLTPKLDEPLRPEEAALPSGLALPRGPLERPVLAAAVPESAPSSSDEPIPSELRLPRAGVRENRPIAAIWDAPPSYPLAETGAGYPENAVPVPDRWRQTAFSPWTRYGAADPDESPFARPEPRRWHYYRQSVLKGDLPIRGQDQFLSLTATSELAGEDRTLTAPRAVDSAVAGAPVSFGRSRTHLVSARLALQVDLFRGETVFKPVDWLIRVRPVLSFTRVPARAAGVVSLAPGSEANPFAGEFRGPTMQVDPIAFVYRPRAARDRGTLALQEAFVERHLRDLSVNYDFLSVRVGNQGFNSDFRGLVFNDTNLGARVFGNYGGNRWQYNAAVFDLREKDPFSDLNTVRRRDQWVAVANLYRQDFWQKGYTAQVSVHASWDGPTTHLNPDGILVRPAPLGTVRPHRVTSYYAGWAGDGHIGRWNVSHAAYLVAGRDDFNGLAGRPVDIWAQMAAAEASYDRDWFRFKVYGLYASGDRNAADGRATGFDAIVDNATFAGGPFSYYARQGLSLAHTAGGLKPRASLFPDLRPSKTAAQQNFVNPGLVLTGAGAEGDLTPRLRAVAHASVIRFATTAPLRAIHPGRQSAALGTDLSLGVQWRPLLTNNLVISAGCGVLLPARGYRDMFRPASVPSPAPPTLATSEAVGRWVHSAVLSTVLTY